VPSGFCCVGILAALLPSSGLGDPLMYNTNSDKKALLRVVRYARKSRRDNKVDKEKERLIVMTLIVSYHEEERTKAVIWLKIKI
jgi:hypothetical protein